jgi:hypothetical protein
VSHLLEYLRRHHVGLLALLVVLGGTAYAAAQVTSKEIQNRTITAKDIKPNTLSGKQIKDGTLGGSDLADGSLSARNVADTSLSAADVADGSVNQADIGDDLLTGADVDEASLNLSRIVARLRDPANHAITRNQPAGTTLGETAPWIQHADEDDLLAGQFTVSFPAGCVGSRFASLTFLRQGFPIQPFPAPGAAANGSAFSSTGGAQTVVAPIFQTNFTPAIQAGDIGRFEPGADVTQKLNVVATASCGGGSTADPVISDIKLDVLGFR